MSIQTTQEKFLADIEDIYDAEHRFLKGMQLMQQKASDKALQTMIRDHMQQTEGQIKNLDEVFSLLGQQPKAHKCDAAAGLVTEAEKNIEEAGSDPIRDCFIDAAAAKVEHYEIASYRGLITGAKGMGKDQIVTLLQNNLRQEEQTAEKLEQSAKQLLHAAMANEGK